MLHNFLLALVVAFVVAQIATFSTTIYLHRAETHRSLELHPAVAWMFRFALWLTTGMSTKEWVAVHRKHHNFTDVEGDPHSPFMLGFLSVQLGNVFHYISEVKKLKETGKLEHYSQGVKEDWFGKHGLFGPLAGIVILSASFSLLYNSIGAGLLWGTFAGVAQFVIYVFILSSSINGLCHVIGFKDFEDSHGTNITILALLTGGEGWHNVHHKYPRSPKFSWSGSQRWEFDPSWPIIKTLVWLNLATRSETVEERLLARQSQTARANVSS